MTDRDRYNPQVEGLLRQFSIDGPKGTSNLFRMRYEFMYLPQQQKDEINWMVEQGIPFQDAFWRVTKGEDENETRDNPETPNETK